MPSPTSSLLQPGDRADLVWLYLQHPYVRGLYEAKARIDSAREFQLAHMDALEETRAEPRALPALDDP